MKNQTGLSMVEVLVAITLSLLVLAGVIQIMTQAKQGYRLGLAFNQMQENTRFAMDYLPKLLRQSGYRSTPDNQNFQEFNEVFGNAPHLSVVDNAGVNGSDILSIRFEGSGDGAGNPDGLIVDCLQQPLDANTMVTNVLSLNADNQLECQSQNIDAPSATRSEILLSGVENMQVLLGEDIDGDLTVDRYVFPNFVGLSTDRVLALKLSLLMVSEEAVQKGVESGEFNLLGTVYTPADDLKLRRQMGMTIYLRNVTTQ